MKIPRAAFPTATVVVCTLASGFTAARGAVWEFAPAMPAPKSNTFAVVHDGAIYMVGDAPWRNGGDQDGSVFRLADGVWNEAAPLTGMGPAVGQGGGVDALDRIVVFGGMIYPDGDFAESRVYDPVEGPVSIPADASVNNPPLNFGLAVDGAHRIYRLGGGCDDCISNHTYSSRYDGATDSWEPVAPLPWARSSIASAYDGQGHIWGFGGYTSFGLPRIPDTIRYTIATNTWTTMGSLFLPVRTSDAKAVLGADGRVYVIGGLAGAYDGVPTTTVYVLDPGVTDPVLETGPPLNVGRYDFGVVLGDDDWIYVIGGVTAEGPTATVERLYTGNAPPLPGDVDGDGDVDFADILAAIAAWGPCPAPPAACPADLSGNGAVDFADLLAILAGWTG